MTGYFAWGFSGYIAMVWSAVLLGLASTPVYEVSSVISVKPNRSDATSNGNLPLARSQIALLESETVVRGAISSVGFAKLSFQRPRFDTSGAFQFADQFINAAEKLLNRQPNEYGAPDGVRGGRWVASLDAANNKAASSDSNDRAGGAWRAAVGRDQDESALRAARAGLRVTHEPLTDLIRVSFRHRDPELAVNFTNALVHSFTERYYDLYTNASAVNFFWQRHKESEEAFAKASSALAEFSAANQLFRIEDQRRLLLEQRGQLTSALAGTEGAIVEKESQSREIPHQLAQMKPIARVPQINNLTQRTPQDRQSDEPAIAALSSDPPLLLVRVYQETVATLVRLKTDLAGLRALANHQAQNIKQSEAELSRLASKEAEFERLRLEVNRAKEYSELYTRKAAEERLTQDLNISNLSGVKVVQAATRPFEAIWPKPILLWPAGVILTLGPLLALGIHRRRPKPSHDRAE